MSTLDWFYLILGGIAVLPGIVIFFDTTTWRRNIRH